MIDEQMDPKSRAAQVQVIKGLIDQLSDSALPQLQRWVLGRNLGWPPPRKPKLPERLKASAAHVTYEIEMMTFTADHLGSGHCSPSTPPDGPEKDGFLDSFLVHYRNLRAFLCPVSLDDDNVLASDFFDKPGAENEAE